MSLAMCACLMSPLFAVPDKGVGAGLQFYIPTFGRRSNAYIFFVLAQYHHQFCLPLCQGRNVDLHNPLKQRLCLIKSFNSADTIKGKQNCHNI